MLLDYLKSLKANGKPANEIAKNYPPHVINLYDDIKNKDRSWFHGQSIPTGSVYGMIPSMVLAPKVQFKYNDKIYEENQMKFIKSIPGTGAGVLIYEKPN